MLASTRGRQENRNKNVRHMHDVADILFCVSTNPKAPLCKG